ncbi:MAG: hydrogenase maturation nickel metallochaperone HypA [Spirochaetia bacterium]|nr:hydrogenase/urease maturation nickel metallochaperone HypA [Spirochaetota bacterium]MCX8096345.1 hydrogenase/urease maturation nickel metallochaperone HypA [Spirochaetota bacterium]MDW8112294.1 hydrogenase maturation nickel metallochaperone HypA [Spirochaetia bacterium]
MHESLLAKDTLELILKEAKSNNAAKVLKAKITIYDTEDISLESFKFHLKNYSEGTVADGMEVDIDFIQIPIVCNDCGNIFYADIHNYICDSCGSQNTYVSAEERITVDYIDVDIAEARL